MRHHGIAWQDGERRVQRWIDDWIDGDPSMRSELLHENPRRVLHRLETEKELSLDARGNPAIRAVLVKTHRTHSGAHRQRESIKRRIGYSPALREWQALCELHAAAARVPVPEPLAWGILANGDPLLVTEYFAGRSLSSVLEESSLSEQMRWVDRLAQSVERLHETGFRHGDLHLGNLHVREDQVMILDLQRARRARNRHERLRDLAQLDFSIARLGFALDLRRRLRSRLGDPPGLDAAARHFVRDFVRGRSRREFRIGRAWERWLATSRASGIRFSGLRDARTAQSTLDQALEMARSDPREGNRRGRQTRVASYEIESRPFVIKRTATTSRRARLRNILSGSRARRSFRRGQRLALLGTIGARPLASIEESRTGAPALSWLILESVGRCDLDQYQPASQEDAECCGIALARWIAEWHAWGIDHRDLKASNIRIDKDRDGFRFWLIDLEDIRFRRSVGDEARLRSLVQLNASLDDDVFSLETRKAALDAYLTRLPFGRRNARKLIESIPARSVARRHRWQGRGCGAAESSRL